MLERAGLITLREGVDRWKATQDDIAAYLRSLRLPEEADYWRDTPVIGSTEGPQGGTQ